MRLNAHELISKSQDQRSRNRREEALVSALAAAEAEPDNSDAWWEVALSSLALDDRRHAISALRRTVQIEPDADGAWLLLGDALLKEGDVAEAKDALVTALSLAPGNPKALEALATVYASEDDRSQDHDEIAVLERIDRAELLAMHRINRLGALHYRCGHPHEAIRYWNRGAPSARHPALRFNLGLAYSHPEVSQDADAIDMWRLTLDQWPDYEPARKSIARALPRLLELAAKVKKYPPTLLPREQWYDHYLNPLQALHVPEDIDFDDLDPKTLQRKKKTLLQEIDLEDGQVSWLPEIRLDKSRSIGLCDELNDDRKREFHWLVFQDKPLLAFLSTGAHEHFLVDPHASELITIGAFEDEESGFRDWLGPLFAQQFDRVLAKAIEKGNLPILECLLDGRRRVPPAYQDRCFVSAQRAVDSLIEPLREANRRADAVKPSVRDVETLLSQGGMLGIMNLLPTYFERWQNEVIHAIRGIAVSCFNAHGDIDLAREIVELAKRFRFRSAAANRLIQDDLRQIEELIRQERQHEARLTIRGKAAAITKEGAEIAGLGFVPAAEVYSLQWGGIVTGDPSQPMYDFLLLVAGEDGRRLSFQWNGSGDFDGQKALFHKLLDAVMNYLFPGLVQRAQAKLERGHALRIGPCRVSRAGIQIEVKGWFSTDVRTIPWDRARLTVNNGELTVQDISSLKTQVSFSLRDTPNAPLLQALANINDERNA